MESGKIFLAERTESSQAPRRGLPPTQGTAVRLLSGGARGERSERRGNLGLGPSESSCLPQAGTGFLLAHVCQLTKRE